MLRTRQLLLLWTSALLPTDYNCILCLLCLRTVSVSRLTTGTTVSMARELTSRKAFTVNGNTGREFTVRNKTQVRTHYFLMRCVLIQNINSYSYSCPASYSYSCPAFRISYVLHVAAASLFCLPSGYIVTIVSTYRYNCFKCLSYRSSPDTTRRSTKSCSCSTGTRKALKRSSAQIETKTRI